MYFFLDIAGIHFWIVAVMYDVDMWPIGLRTKVLYLQELSWGL
jgi:hypothetical protein